MSVFACLRPITWYSFTPAGIHLFLFKYFCSQFVYPMDKTNLYHAPFEKILKLQRMVDLLHFCTCVPRMDFFHECNIAFSLPMNIKFKYLIRRHNSLPQSEIFLHTVLHHPMLNYTVTFYYNPKLTGICDENVAFPYICTCLFKM